MPRPDDQEFRPGLSPPRFHLSTMFWGIAVLCVVFAIMGSAGPVGAFVMVLLLLSVVAHVLGTALGKKLRDGDQPARRVKKTVGQSPELDEESFAPQSNLSERSSLGMLILVFTIVGALLGGTIGGVALTLLYWESIRWPAIAVAAVASAVLGGFVGFMASSFVRVAYAAQAEAWRESRR